MPKLKSLSLAQTIEVSKSKAWDVLFTQFGNVHTHNPNLEGSHFIKDYNQGRLGCERRCNIDSKTFLEEKITKVNDLNSFELTVTNSNFPMVEEMKAKYNIHELSENRSKVVMTLFMSTSPAFMVYLMKGQMKKLIRKYLIGLKYYLETGREVSKSNFNSVFKEYKSLNPAASFE